MIRPIAPPRPAAGSSGANGAAPAAVQPRPGLPLYNGRTPATIPPRLTLPQPRAAAPECIAAAEKLAELKKKKEEEEAQRKAHIAAVAVRKVMQRVRVATRANYDDLRTELEDSLSNNLEALGTLAEKVSQEALQALEGTQQRLDEAARHEEAAERRRTEEERRRNEQSSRVDKLLGEMLGDVADVQAKLADAEETARAFGDAGVGPEELVAAATTVEEAVKVLRDLLKTTAAMLVDKQREMGDNEFADKVRQEVEDLHGKIQVGRAALVRLEAGAASAKERAGRRAVALRRERELQEAFRSHDTDADGLLSREEVAAFSRAEFEFEISSEVLDRLMAVMEPIGVEKFRSLRQKIAIARSEAKARAEAAEAEKRRAQVEEKRAAVQQMAKDAADHLTSAERDLARAEATARPLLQGNNEDMTSSALKDGAAAVEKFIGQVTASLAKALEAAAQVEKECAGVKEFEGIKKEAPRLHQRHERGSTRLEKVTVAMKATQERLRRKTFADMDAARSSIAVALRSKMVEGTKTPEQLLQALLGGKPELTQEGFAAAIEGFCGVKLDASQAEDLFKHAAGTSKELTKEGLAWLLRLAYVCVRSTVLSEELSIRAKTLRRLEPGEVLETLEGPLQADDAPVKRVKCQAVEDGAIGWATVSGNQTGTAFLKPEPTFNFCLRETVLTDGCSVQDSKSLRRLAKGEVVELLEYARTDPSLDVKRVKAKALLDGAVGWLTVKGNQGTPYLEAC